MRNLLGSIKFISILLIASILTGIALWLLVRTILTNHSENGFRKDTNSRTDVHAVVVPKKIAGFHDVSRSSSQRQSRAGKLVGTWKKQRTCAIDQILQDFNDNDWHLTVRFTEDGRFGWDSERYMKDGKLIDDSLTGTYSIERGFLIDYHFDSPSPAALLRLPELFAFWPNQLLGKQTFRFQDGNLVLGHDGEKIYIDLKRSTGVE